MAEDALIAALEDDAKAQVSRIIEEAREAADAALRGAMEEADQERDERLTELKERVKKERASRINAARSASSGLKLKVRHELIGSVFEKALEMFRKLPREDYSALLNGLYAELKEEWERLKPGAETVLVNPNDTGLIKGASAAADPSISLGVVFTTNDARVRLENTIPARLEKARKTMYPAINEMLFGEVF